MATGDAPSQNTRQERGGGLRGRFLGSRVTVTSVVDTIGGLYVFAARAIATRQETQSSARPLELNFSCTVHATEKYATTDRYRLIERRQSSLLLLSLLLFFVCRSVASLWLAFWVVHQLDRTVWGQPRILKPVTNLRYHCRVGVSWMGNEFFLSDKK